MREVNGVYTQAFNRHYRWGGHVLQGRYKAILMNQNTYLLELARYIVLNPVRAGLVPSAGESAWSSYQAVMEKTPAPDWQAVDDILAMFHFQRGLARRAYARFVRDGIDAFDSHEEIQRAGILGSDAFVERILEPIDRHALRPVRTQGPAGSFTERDCAAPHFGTSPHYTT